MQLSADHIKAEQEVNAALDQLKESGYKVTKKRKEIIEIFAQQQRYLNATYIHNLMSEQYPTMSYNTTYRNIYDFVKLGILETTEYNQEQHFRINCLEPHHHHHHFICTKCGRAILLDFCPMDLSKVSQSLEDVEVSSHRFEVFGNCAECIAV